MKSIQGIFRSTVVFALAAILMIGNANATSANTDLTDIWWNKNKSGNGYQFINTGTFVFATAYLYGANRQPFWISAELSKTGAAQTTYTGPLYVTSGPYYGGPYDPATVTFQQAGTMTVVLTGVSTGQLSYVIDGVPVTEPIERQPLTLDNYNGTYLGGSSSSYTGCSNPAHNGEAIGPVAVEIVQNGTSMTQTWTYLDDTVCTYFGTYSQLGRMGRFVATYSCSVGEAGTLEMVEMTNAINMFMAREHRVSSNLGCQVNGNISGVTVQ